MSTSSSFRPFGYTLFAVIVLAILITLESSSPPSATVTANTPDSAEEQDDNDAPDTGFVNQEEDLGNDPMRARHLDLGMVPIDTGTFALEATDTGLVALFAPIPNTDSGLEFIPAEIDDGLLPDPPKRFDGFNLSED